MHSNMTQKNIQGYSGVEAALRSMLQVYHGWIVSFSKNNQPAIVAAVALSVRDNGITLWEQDGGRAGSLLSQISHLSLTSTVQQPPFQVGHNFDRG